MAKLTMEGFIEAIAKVGDGKALVAKLAQIKAAEDKMASYEPIIATLEDAQVLVEQAQEKSKRLLEAEDALGDKFRKLEKELAEEYVNKKDALKADFDKQKLEFEGMRQMKADAMKAFDAAQALRTELDGKAKDLARREDMLRAEQDKLKARIEQINKLAGV